MASRWPARALGKRGAVGALLALLVGVPSLLWVALASVNEARVDDWHAAQQGGAPTIVWYLFAPILPPVYVLIVAPALTRFLALRVAPGSVPRFGTTSAAVVLAFFGSWAVMSLGLAGAAAGTAVLLAMLFATGTLATFDATSTTTKRS